MATLPAQIRARAWRVASRHVETKQLRRDSPGWVETIWAALRQGRQGGPESSGVLQRWLRGTAARLIPRGTRATVHHAWGSVLAGAV